MRLFLLALIVVIGGGCSTVAPDPGFEAVIVHKPAFIGKGGVDKNTVKTGRTYTWITSENIVVNMQPQLFQLKFDDFMTSDGVPLDFDAAIRLRVSDAVLLVEKFGHNWYDNNVANELAQQARQAVRKRGLNETAIQTTAIDAIDSEVTEKMKAYFQTIGLPVMLESFSVGKANPPDSVKDQRIATAAQQQRIITEQERKLAEDKRKMAEESRAAADNAYREKMKMSPDQFLQLEAIKMMNEVCNGGKCTFISDSVTPTFNVNK
jgi:regulator of protease activity HflC (stomatin/prohibitin superfamily)